MNRPVLIRELREDEYPIWNDMVEASPYGTVYHDTRWLKAICQATNGHFTVYGCFHEDQLIAGLPLQIRKKGPLTLARRAFATPYCNTVVDSSWAGNARPLIDAAMAHAAQNHSQTIVTDSPFTASLGLSPRWKAVQRSTYLLDISDSEKAWQRFAYQLQKKIRKAIRLGVTFEAGCQPETFFQLYEKTFRRRGLAVPFSALGFARFLDAVTRDAPIGKTYLTRTDDGPCAAGLVLFDNKRAYYALAGTDIDATDAPASALLLWEIIRDLSSTHHLLDLVGANIPGINRFKKQFAGELVTYREVSCYRSTVEKGLIWLYQRIRV